MNSAEQYQPHYTVHDYCLWEGEWELWNGNAVAMTPIPFGRYASVLGRIVTALNNAIARDKCPATVLVEIDWIVANDTVLRPDVTVVCGQAPERHVQETPALVVEVLSESTRERDLIYKRKIYEEQTVRWYLILDPDESTLQALKLDSNGEYQQVAQSETLQVDLRDDCSMNVSIEGLFV